MKSLKVLLWNLQDFYVFLDKYNNQDLSTITEPFWQQLTASFTPNKPIEKLREIANLIKLKDPDLCFFTEIGGAQSINNFNKYFLDSAYQVLHHKSNSDRGIDLAILVNKKSKLSFYEKFHKNREFARGVHSLRLNFPHTRFIFNLIHLKSKLNKDNKDFEGRGQREKEIKKLMSIIESKQEVTDKQIILGDFNSIIYKENTEEEILPLLKKFNLKDVCEVKNLTLFDRATYIYYPRAGSPQLMQLDYALLTPKAQEKLKKVEVLDFDGTIKTTIPSDYNQRQKLPSDHYPLYFELEL